MPHSPTFATRRHWHLEIVSTSSTTWGTRTYATCLEILIAFRRSGCAAQAALAIAGELEVLALRANPVTWLWILLFALSATMMYIAQHSHLLHLLHHHWHQRLNHRGIELIHHSSIGTSTLWLRLSAATACGVPRELMVGARRANPIALLHRSVLNCHRTTHHAALALTAILWRRTVLGVPAASANRVSRKLMISACAAAPISRCKVLSPIVAFSALLHGRLDSFTAGASFDGRFGISRRTALAAVRVTCKLVVTACRAIPIAGFKRGHVPSLSF